MDFVDQPFINSEAFEIFSVTHLVTKPIYLGKERL